MTPADYSVFFSFFFRGRHSVLKEGRIEGMLCVVKFADSLKEITQHRIHTKGVKMSLAKHKMSYKEHYLWKHILAMMKK